MGSDEWSLQTRRHWRLILLSLVRVREHLEETPTGNRALLDMTLPYEHAVLDVTSFVILCDHLRDYLKEFDKRTDVKGFVRGDPDLSMCRDLSVNFKHARMAWGPWTVGGDSASIASVGAIRVDVSMDEDGGLQALIPVATARALQITNSLGQTTDAWTLVKGCVGAWIRYGLPSSSHEWPED